MKKATILNKFKDKKANYPAKLKQWSEENMLAALSKLYMKGLWAALVHSVPATTLKDRLSMLLDMCVLFGLMCSVKLSCIKH